LLSYPQFNARLSIGDLHPGGVSASEMMLDWLAARRVNRVLEVGAGIGNTAARMADRRWEVTAIEPDPVLFAQLQRRLGAAARREAFLAHRPPAPYDAILAESVFFQMDLAEVFSHARGLLKPGGYLAFVEAVWTEGITAAKSGRWYEDSKRLFGIPVGSREPWTWHDWQGQLRRAGFETACAQLLPAGAAGQPPVANWRASIVAMVSDPRLMLYLARFRLRRRLARMPPGAQETWVFLGTSLARH
jgi:SAM-dependent methyltransferase